MFLAECGWVRREDVLKNTQIYLNNQSLVNCKTLSLPQTSRANPVQCYSTHQEEGRCVAKQIRRRSCLIFHLDSNKQHFFSLVSSCVVREENLLIPSFVVKYIKKKGRCGWQSVIEFNKVGRYSLLHLECYLILMSNLNLIGLFSTERGKRDLEN